MIEPSEAIEDVITRHYSSVMAMEGVVGLAEGSDDDESVIVVLLEAKQPEIEKKLPKSLGGYRVVARVIGTLDAKK